MASILTAYAEAYKAGDYTAMAALYDPSFTFTDPAFGPLGPKKSRAMFAFFCDSRARSKQVVAVVEAPVKVDSPAGKAAAPDGEWYRLVYTCDYLFGGRPVHNRITSTLEVADGLIREQIDDFDMAGWAKQALGWTGVLLVCLGLTGVIRKTANRNLQDWIVRKGRQEEFHETETDGDEGGR